MKEVGSRLVLLAALSTVLLLPGGMALAQETPTSPAPNSTEAPTPTEAPPATEDPGEEETSSTLVWLFLGLAVVAFLLVGVLIGRGNRQTPTQQPPPVSEAKGFTDYVRDGYSEARWLLDTMNGDLAIWRGNALFEGRTSSEDSASTALAHNWAQLDQRVSDAADQLYRAEAAAPDQNSADMVRATIDAMNRTRAALDARAKARLNSRRLDESDQLALAESAESERVASASLNLAHQEMNDALLALSALI